MIDELCETIDMARDLFSIKEVSSETNPNHLTHEYLEKLKGRVQRLSVGVQSFDDDLLRQMDRYEKYGSGQEILERIQEASPYFTSMNADMIFNFPTQPRTSSSQTVRRSRCAAAIRRRSRLCTSPTPPRAKWSRCWGGWTTKGTALLSYLGRDPRGG